jgi:hypothetical protein
MIEFNDLEEIVLIKNNMVMTLKDTPEVLFLDVSIDIWSYLI